MRRCGNVALVFPFCVNFRFLFDGLSKFLVSHQHWLYYLVMLFARFNLYLQTLMLCLAPKAYRVKRGVHEPRVDLIGQAGFVLWQSALMSYMPDWWHVLGFVLVSIVTCTPFPSFPRSHTWWRGCYTYRSPYHISPWR